jgi:hypothetical protein
MTTFPITQFLDITDFAVPATLVDAAGNETEISVIFDRNYSASNFGELNAENYGPSALCREQDVRDANKNYRLIVHYGILTDERGNPITDEAGNQIIAENEFTYKVKRPPETDEFGMARLILSID